jgi:hypothetical protein
MIARGAAAPTTEAVITEIAVTVSRREVLRYLGYPRVRPPKPQVAEVLDRLWEPAHRLITPVGTYRVVGRDAARATGMPTPTEVVGLGVCTAGPALEREERERIADGQMLEALILDAFGSAAAEAATNAVNAQLCAVAQGWGFRLAPRVSPGYGRWDIEGQPELLGLLDAGAIGVTFTEGLMMVPRKSISFGVHFEHGLSAVEPARHGCVGCELTNCAYRYDDSDPGSEAKVE